LPRRLGQRRVDQRLDIVQARLGRTRQGDCAGRAERPVRTRYGSGLGRGLDTLPLFYAVSVR
jgi:hypothetical protein